MHETDINPINNRNIELKEEATDKDSSDSDEEIVYFPSNNININTDGSSKSRNIRSNNSNT